MFAERRDADVEMPQDIMAAQSFGVLRCCTSVLAAPAQPANSDLARSCNGIGIASATRSQPAAHESSMQLLEDPFIVQQPPHAWAEAQLLLQQAAEDQSQPSEGARSIFVLFAVWEGLTEH